MVVLFARSFVLKIIVVILFVAMRNDVMNTNMLITYDKITDKQINYLLWQIKKILNGDIGSDETQKIALDLFPEDIENGVNKVWLHAEEKLRELTKDEASGVIQLFYDEKVDEGFNQLITIL
jgi:hypothetical protein